MGLRERIAKALAPDMMDAEQVKALVKQEVAAARQAMPINLDYDPKGEGYRRLSSDGQENVRRDLSPLSQDMMLELAYYLYDTSGLVKRFVRDTKNFVLGEGVTYEVENDTNDNAAKEALDEFWNDNINQMDLRLEKRVEFLGLLGEQCWPVAVNEHSGHVWLSYIDPVNIDSVLTVRNFPEMTAAIQLKGQGGRPGKLLTAIRQETDPRKPEYGRLIGDSFYFSVNNPPNGPRGRSDLIHLFDFINAFEEGLFDELDRLKGIKAFIWDVTLKGATQEEIDEFLQKNKTPKSGSVRAHNEQVEWEAVAPQLHVQDNKTLFEMMRTYMAACQNRPDSWLGSGGKAYQTEADLMGEPTFKDLGSRQRYVKYIIEYILKFALDQRILHKTLKEPKDGKYIVTVNMPETSVKDLKKIVDGLFTLAQSLMIAVTNKWISDETAAKVYASVAGQVGVDIDAAEEIKKAAENRESQVTEDYAAREAMITEIVARLNREKAESSKLKVVGNK